MATEPQLELVRERLSSTRRERRLTLRQAAEQIGVSPTTLSRIERGAGRPDLPTLDALITWLDLDRASVFDAARPEAPSTLEAVQVLLRADKNLNERTARALSTIFESVYKELSDG